MTWSLLHGDCRNLMAEMEEASVDSIVTDPPYELGFMGREWDRSGVAYDVATWTAALRVLKPGGWLVAFGGSRTYHRMACAIEDAGFDIRDQLMWIYGQGFPKGGIDDQGRGTCLKPAHEPVVLARRPFRGTAAANIARHGTGGLNIDACRIGHAKGWPASKRMTPGQMAGGAGDPGGYLTSAEPDALGRWPANVIHDGSEEVVAGFPQTTSGLLPAGTGDRGKGAGVYGKYAGRVVGQDFGGDTGSAARFFYCAKASKADRDEGLAGFAPQAFVQYQTGNGESGRASSLSEGRSTEYRNTHPTVKPAALMRWLVRLVTPEGGLVLDPFAGSGSTGKAAMLEGRTFLGCELTAEYIPIAEARIAAAADRAAREVEDAASTPEPHPDLFPAEAA